MSLCASFDVVESSNDPFSFSRKTCQSSPPLDWWLARVGCRTRFCHDASFCRDNGRCPIDMYAQTKFTSSPFALMDMNDHAFTVDVGDLQVTQLSSSQPGRIKRHQHRAMHQVPSRI